MGRRLRLQGAVPTCEPPSDAGEILDSFLGPYGLYVHVPFCRSICPYCPYNKVLYRAGAVARYFDALRAELRIYGATERTFTSLYVGGGTPSLCLEELGETLSAVDVGGERAIEVFPTHATPRAVSRLNELGFNYVSLGIQSLDPRVLRHLGRLNTVEDNLQALSSAAGEFDCVNADLIFDVAFGEPEVFMRDFEACCRAGVDQLSTYPLMHFGFTPFGKAPHARRAEHELLHRTERMAAKLGYERRSVWTFNRIGSPLYASIARERYLGCGAGAATFTGTDFLVNHFAIEPYVAALTGQRLPIARRARLGRDQAALYYAFWQLYAPGVDLDRFRRLYPDASATALLLKTLRLTGHLRLDRGRLRLTRRGYDRYHDLERWVTYRLIEPLWGEMAQEHAPPAPRGRTRSQVRALRGPGLALRDQPADVGDREQTDDAVAVEHERAV